MNTTPEPTTNQYLIDLPDMPFVAAYGAYCGLRDTWCELHPDRDGDALFGGAFSAAIGDEKAEGLLFRAQARADRELDEIAVVTRHLRPEVVSRLSDLDRLLQVPQSITTSHANTYKLSYISAFAALKAAIVVARLGTDTQAGAYREVLAWVHRQWGDAIGVFNTAMTPLLEPYGLSPNEVHVGIENLTRSTWQLRVRKRTP